MKNQILLQMQHISKTFPGVIALNNVQFELKEGEVHILLGENGAGKSTLVKILSGAYQKSSGQILLNGQEVIIKNPKHAQELGISIIYQELNLIPYLSTAENIFLSREPKLKIGMIKRKQLNLSAQKILNELGLLID